MADGANISLDPERSARLNAAAAAAGLSPEAYALNALDQAMDDDWTEALASLEEYDLTGVSISADDAIAEFRAHVEARIAQSS